MKKKLVGVVTLYNPDNAVIENIGTYIRYLEKLYVVDNSPICNHEFCLKLKKVYSGLICLATGENLGISVALNLALKKAISEGYNYLLTMDQDSFFLPDQARRYFASLQEVDFSSVAVVSPLHREIETDDGICIYEEKDIVWTSGNVLNIVVAEKIAMFDERLFIDSVDHEYCLRARVRGYRILQAQNCFLNHEVGEKRAVRGLFKKKCRRFHSPERFYYMIRNSFIISENYGDIFMAFHKKHKKELWKEFIRALKYSNRRRHYLYYAVKAWRDYRHGLYGNRIGL